MEITLIEEVFPIHTITEGRSTTKPHVTDIIADIEKTTGKEYQNQWDSRLCMEAGFLWEDVLSFAFKEKLAIRPPELELDGIVMNPDGIDFTDWIVEEYKYTWLSSKNTPDSVWRWMAQVKSYCMGIGKSEGRYPHVKFRVFHSNGNYKGSGPQYPGVYLIKFTDREIESNWEMIVNHARYRGWINE